MMDSKPVRGEELLDYPCDHLFKAFGPAAPEADFETAVRRAVAAVVPLADDAVKVRPSGQGTYVCVTVLVRLYNADQLRRIYLGLREVEGLCYLL